MNSCIFGWVVKYCKVNISLSGTEAGKELEFVDLTVYSELSSVRQLNGGEVKLLKKLF